MKSDLLIEIGVEEIPASYLKPAAEEFCKKLISLFHERNIPCNGYEVFFTPRRIAVLCMNVADHENVTTKKVFGPPAEMAFNGEGKPTAAATGFAKSFSKNPKDLKIGIRKEKKVCYLELQEKPEQTKRIIQTELGSIIQSLCFPKKMKWEKTGFMFARPIRWLVVLYGKNVIKLSIAGVKSSKVSFAPRFKGSKSFSIQTSSSYETTLEKHSIIASYKKRKEMIAHGIKKKIASKQCVIDDTKLLDEVTNLVEYPTVFKGKFDKQFLALPQDVLVTAMREHQRYFAVLSKKNMKIEPVYIGVSNSLDENIGEIANNNNHVLRARLNDAKFYWDEDLKSPFAESIDKLKGIEWHKGLGTVYDKTMRLVALSDHLFDFIRKGNRGHIARGALLSKVDLVSNMIKDGKEFTTLEGIIGREYALQSKEEEAVANIISEHYLPRFPNDRMPITIESAIVGVADRIDTLIGNFLLGEIPTGSSDPFGLRRCANGLLRVLDKFALRFSFQELAMKSISLYSAQKSISEHVKSAEVLKRLKAFLSTRITSYLSLQGIRYDIPDAVLVVHFDNIYESLSRIKALDEESFEKDFDKLIIGQRRVSNILKGISVKHKDIDASLFDCSDEENLWKNCIKTEKIFSQAMNQKDYKSALKALLALRPSIDNFFDNCLVMTEDEQRRNNRIAILFKVKAVFDSYANFSIIVIEGEK